MDNQKPLNVGQQPNPDKYQKIIAQDLGAKNIGVDKILLNINSGQGELKSNNNSIIKYSLKQPISLEVGDMVTLVSSFVEERGLSENTISFEKDVEAEMRFLYYKQSDPGDTQTNGSDAQFCQYPKMMPDFYTDLDPDNSFNPPKQRVGLKPEFIQQGTMPGYAGVVGDCGLNGTNSSDPYSTNKTPEMTSGPNGQMNYLMETHKYDQDDERGNNFIYYRPVYGIKTIRVNAGNYSVDSLANIITSQMNGSIGENNDTFSDALKDKLYFPEKSINEDVDFWKTLPFFKNIGIPKDVHNTEIFGNENPLDINSKRRVEGFVRQLNYSNKSWYNAFRYVQLIDAPNRFSTTSPGLETRQYPNGTRLTDTFPLFYTDAEGHRQRRMDLLDIQTPNKQLSNSNAVNFYVGALHLKYLFNNDDGLFYCNPRLATQTVDYNDTFRPPTHTEMMNLQLSMEFGIVPPVEPGGTFPRGNGAVWSATYPRPGFFRGILQENAMAFNCLYPVMGLTYPGSDADIPIARNVYAGSSVSTLSFGDAVDNRFSFTNFHEFYKLSNLTADGKTVTDFAGQQATKLNNPYYNDGGVPLDQNNGSFFDKANAVYPIDSSSGVMITNFDLNLVKDTAVYKNLKKQIDDLLLVNTLQAQQYREKLLFDLLTKKYDEFFDSETDAKNAWLGGLWSRLGFSYEQLGKIAPNCETNSTYGGPPYQAVYEPNISPNPKARTIGRENVKNLGIITHNEFDFTKIVSSDGLGSGNPTTVAGTPLQNYRLSDYYPGKTLTDNLGINSNIIHLLATSKPLAAQQLPSLNAGKSYLLIESDIIKPNYKDVRANWGNLLGIMSKENSSNDTIFGAEPIDFTITEPRLLSDITLFIKNPDGSLAGNDVIGSNCGFIIQITKAIKPQALPEVAPP